MRGRKNERYMKLLSIFAVIVVAAVVGHIVSIVSYNSREYVAQGASPNRESYLLLEERKDTTSAWLKRDFDLEGQRVDLSGQIFDGALKNQAVDEISAWRLTLRFHGDCYLNNAWCGLVEIHQGVAAGREKVQTLDLRHCDRSEIELDYLPEDSDLMIPLHEGDYLVYYPSAADREVPVQAGGSLEMGMIFYYLGVLDLSDYDITYSYHKSFTEGAEFYFILTLVVLWLAAFFGLVVSSYAYRKAMVEMEHRKVGISYMAVIYDFICIVDLVNDNIVHIYGNVPASQNFGRQLGVTDRLKKMFMDDIADEYVEPMRKFFDIATLSQRIEGKSLACEYMDREGRCYIVRLFPMEQEPGQPLERFIFAMRNIDEERNKMMALQESRSKEEPVVAVAEAYSVRELLENLAANIREAVGRSDFELETDISPNLPELVMGYPQRLRLVLFCLLLRDTTMCAGGKMKLSVYGKAAEGRCHLLFALKSGVTAGQQAGLGALCLKAAGEILATMSTELSVLGGEGEQSEFYFELDQEICDK